MRQCGVGMCKAVCVMWGRGVQGSVSRGVGVCAAWGKEAELKGRSC